MKKVLLTLLAVFMAVPAFAIEVYNNGDTNVDIYGTIRGYVGYGLGVTGDSTSTTGGVESINSKGSMDHNMLYGLQGNSRIGTKFKVGAFAGQVELGFNEKTILTQKTGDTVGIRQAWGSYTFGNAGTLLFGKTDTPTSMSGFISDIYDTDGGLNGFGGVTTGNRRFQIQYNVAGLSLALIEDDVDVDNDFGNTGAKLKNPYTPRGAISYTFKNDSLMAKVAATYTAVNGYYADNTQASGKAWTNLHAFGVTAGVRPTFGNMYLSVLARYGMNEDLYGEAKTVANVGSYAHTDVNKITGLPSISRSLHKKADGTIDGFNNIHRAAVSLEYGMKLTEQFTLAIGAGYQATIQEFDEFTTGKIAGMYHSYAAFLQGNYAITKNFSFIPEVAWFGTILDNSDTTSGTEKTKTASQSGLLVGAQFRATF